MQEEIKKISKKYGLSHIGSCISVYSILEEIYKKKRPEDKVILDNAHSHLTHLFFLDTDIEKNLVKYGIHCHKKAGCDISGGSLGHAIGIGIGLALIDRNRDIYCIVSDGSMMEGSNWEALRLIDEWGLKNIKIYCNFNGYSAVANIDLEKLEKRMRIFTDIEVRQTYNGDGFDGVYGHYKVL